MVDEVPRSEPEVEFEKLAPDADRATRRRLGEEFAPQSEQLMEDYHWLRDPGSHAPRGAAFAEQTMGQALRELYNSAQLEVLYRAHLISTGATDDLDVLEAALDAAAPPRTP